MNKSKYYFAGLLLGCVALQPCGLGLWGQTPEAGPAPASPPGGAVVPPDALLAPGQEKEVFDALDLSAPGLQEVKTAVDKNDMAAAEHALAQYFRARTRVPWSFDPRHPDKATPYNKQVADDAVRGRVKGGQIPVWYQFPDGKIDWLYNATYHMAGVAPNFGWQPQLCRMDFWGEMAAAYRATGDEKYAKAWVQQLRSFVSQCPPPEEIPGHLEASAWHPIDVGVRNIASWPDAYFSFVLSPSVSDRDLLVCVYGFLLNAQYLETHHGPGNGLLMERQGLFTIGCVFPEFKMAAQWREDAIKGEMAQVAALFLPDGVEAEMTTGYHSGAIINVMGIPKVAKLVGRSDEIPPEYIKPMERAYDFEMYMMAPDRQLPMFNDAWMVHEQGLLRDALPYFPNRQDFLWVATDGKQGQPPAQTSKAFDWGGLYAMRSSWAPDANYLAFSEGPFVFSHGHQAKLIVVMWAYGRELLFNSGGGPYDASKWRQYSIDTFSKNTVLVDGLPQRRPRNEATANVPRIDSRWESTPDYDFVAGTYDEAYGDRGLHPAVHVRRVLFLKPDLGIVADTLTPNDAASHTYQARWHLLTTHTTLSDSTHEVTTTDSGRPNLDIVPLNTTGLEVSTASGQLEPELLGWNVLHNTVRQPAAATTVLQTLKGTGVQNFLTLLVPMRPGADAPVKSVESAGACSAKVTFSDGRKLEIVVDPSPAGGIEATEIMADGSAGRHIKAGQPR